LKKSQPLVIFTLAFLLTLIVTLLLKVYGDVPQKYKLSPLGVKSWSEVNLLELPEAEKKDLLFKSNVLYIMQRIPEGERSIEFSSDGKFRVVKRKVEDPQDEDNVEAIIYDSLGKKIWQGLAGGWIQISNNGNDFVSKGLSGGPLYFHKISDGPPNFEKPAPSSYYQYSFSYDGKYFIGAGNSLDLLKASGEIIWRKNINGGGANELTFTNDANKIALAIAPWLSLNREPVLTDIKDTVATRHLDRSTRNVYIFILNRAGEILNSIVVAPHYVQQMEFTKDGSYLAVSSYNELYLFEVLTGKLAWNYKFGSPCALITSLAFSGNSDVLAAGGVTCQTDKYSDRFVYLFDIKGQVLDSTKVLDTYSNPTTGPSLEFSSSGNKLLVGTTNKVHAFTLVRD